MDIKKQIADLQATRKSKADRMRAIQEKAAEQTRTLDTGEQEEFDSLKAEIGTIDKNIGNLRDLEQMEEVEKANARPADGTENANKPVTIERGTGTPAEPKNTQKLDPGIGFARAAKCLWHSREHNVPAADVAKHLYPGDARLVETLTQKAAANAASTLSDPWANNLVLDRGAAFADFVEYLRPRTVLGQVQDRLRRLPFDTPVLIQATAGNAAWTKEGEGKPVTQWTYTKAKLEPLKVTAIAVATKELLRRSSPAADTLLRDELARSVVATIDTTFVSADAAVADEAPAGLRNGVTPLNLTGDGTVAGIRCDLEQFLNALVGQNLSVSGAFWIMPETVAVSLSLVANEVGATAFPGISPTGGTLAGLPVFTSQYATVDSDGAVVMLVKGDEIFLGDEGGIQVSISDQASLQMDTAPTQNSITPTATQVVSMFQTNSVAFLVERFLNWQKRRAQAVVWGYVNWSACQTP